MMEEVTPAAGAVEGGGNDAQEQQQQQAPAEPRRRRRGPREESASHVRRYTVYELGGDGDVLIKDTVDSTSREEACWALIDSDQALTGRALKGGEHAPKLDALPSRDALSFRPFAYAEETVRRRVKGNDAPLPPAA